MNESETAGALVLALVLGFIVAFLGDRYNWRIKEWF